MTDIGSRDAAGDSASPIRGRVRLAGHRRVSHGLYLPTTRQRSLDAEWRRDLEAWSLVLPESSVFTHITAARLLGWQLPNLPEQVPVFAAGHEGVTGPRRYGLVFSRLVASTEPFQVDGFRVDAPEEILLRAARDLGTLDLTIMIDSALRLGHIHVKNMELLLASRRPGVQVLRQAWQLSDARAESAGESLLRLFHRALDIAVVPQVTLYDSNNHELGRADLLVAGTYFVHEYDGAVHRGKSVHRSDLRRDRRLASSPYIRRGYTLDDLLNHALVVMHELDAELGRPHLPARITRWRELIGNSLYSESGRSRVLNRWRRHGGLVDWKPAA